MTDTLLRGMKVPIGGVDTGPMLVANGISKS